MGLLSTIQDQIRDRLAGDQYFAADATVLPPMPAIPILTEQIGDIENEIQRQLASIGVMVVVLTAIADVESPNTPGPYFRSIKVLVRVSENVVINQGEQGTKKHASDIAEHVVALVHLHQPTGLAGFYSAPSGSIILVPDPFGNITYDCEFRTHGGINYVPQPITP